MADLQQFNNRFGKNDTIWSMVIVYEGDTIPAKTYTAVDVYRAMTHAMRRRMEEMTKLRNAVYVTYPYARKAGMILNDMNVRLAKMNSESDKKGLYQIDGKGIEETIHGSHGKAVCLPGKDFDETD